MPDRILSRSTTRGYLAKNVYWKRYGLSEEETESDTDHAGTGHKTGTLKSLEYLTDEDAAEASAAAETAEVGGGLTVYGALVAAVVGYFSLAVLLRALKGRWFWLFGPYCLAAGLLTLILV
jgi:hypothetical protein